ncbi:hypothetical protein TWF281_010122 [Arthrobotrys megalospora]
MVSSSGAISNEEFLLRCIEHGDFKINFAAVAKDLGYASATVAANRMRTLRAKLQEKRQAKEAEGGTQAKKEKENGEANEKPKAKRGRKRKADDNFLKVENVDEKRAKSGD